MMEKLPRERKQEQHQAHPENGNFEYSYLIKLLKSKLVPTKKYYFLNITFFKT